MSAFFTEYLTPKDSFNLCLVLSLGITLAGCFINKHIEARPVQQRDEGGPSFCTDVRRNLGDIREAMRIPQIYRAILFFLLNGLIVPSFGDFSYYFSINIV